MKKVLLILFLIPSAAFSAPTISSVSGTIATGQTVNVEGSGFGSKSRSVLLLWADAQEGVLSPHSTLSNGTAWAQTQNMTIISDSNKRWGAGAFRSNWNYTSSQRAATLRPPSLTVTYGTKFMLSWWEKSDIDYYAFTGGTAQNWKVGARLWVGPGATNYPSHYFISISQGQTSGQLRFSTEFPTASSYMGSSYGLPTNTWRRITALYKMNSSLGSADGTLSIYKNNTLVKNITGWNFNDASHTSFAKDIFFQEVIANANVPSGDNFWITDIAVEDSWNRFEIGNASTYAACTQLELQPYISFTDTTATLNLHLGTISGSAWLYACDTNNNCNSSGYALTTSSNAAPTVVSVSPTHGSASGGTTVTATGTGFISTPTVKVNGVFATSPTFTSSTTISFVTPAGTEGTTGSVEVFNYDGQSGELPSAYTYDITLLPSTTPTTACPCVSSQ